MLGTMYELFERPAIDTSHLSLILTVPGNVADAATALGDWAGYLNGTELDYEILLVSEQAGQSVEDLAAPFARVRPLPAPERGGFGAALALGLEHAQQLLVFYGRCQPAFKPADVRLLLKQIDKVDLVAGQRTLPPGHRQGGFRAALYRWFVRLFFGVQLNDLDCLFVLADVRSLRIGINHEGSLPTLVLQRPISRLLLSDAAVTYRPEADKVTGSAGAMVGWQTRRLISISSGPVQLRGQSLRQPSQNWRAGPGTAGGSVATGCAH